MCKNGLNLEKAKEICKQYQHLLRSSSLVHDRIEVVEEILPAPYDQQNQWVFFNNYHETGDLQAALDAYKHQEYDVIVLIKECYADGLIDHKYMTLENYLKQRHPSVMDSRSRITAAVDAAAR